MPSKKAVSSKADDSAAKRANFMAWLFGPARRGTVSVCLAGMFGAGWYGAWQVVGARALASPAYHLSAGQVEVTPPPEWVHADLVAEALRNAGLDGDHSLFDDDLTARLHAAFAVHPWVAEVGRVRKHHPARVSVELTYRVPVCMVEVPGGLLAVDAGGVLLPSRDFTPVEAARYPRLAGIQTIPVGPPGTCWGDPQVVGAAKIAAVLKPHWQELGLERIAPCPLVDIQFGSDPTYELVTRGSTRIQWGRSPESESPGELSPAEKTARLRAYLRANGSFDGRHGPQDLDVRWENLVPPPM